MIFTFRWFALIFCFFVCGETAAFNGQFWGAVADQMNENARNDNARKMVELEEQRLQLERQRMQFEQDRLGQQQQLESQRRQEELRKIQERQRQAEITKEKERLTGFTGTGFFVSNQGHIVTNAHVVGDHRYLVAKDSNGQLFRLDLVAIERSIDLALLRADTKSFGLPFADAASVQKGMKVYAIGYPQTSIQGNESKITDGIISSMTGLRNDGGWYQISVPIQAGNSGGPLVSEDGRLVGVVVATVNAAKFLSITGDIPQNINFGIKGNVLQGFLDRNGVKPIIVKDKVKLPLGKVDESTLFIATRPVPFGASLARPAPSEAKSIGVVENKKSPTPALTTKIETVFEKPAECVASASCASEFICIFNKCTPKAGSSTPQLTDTSKSGVPVPMVSNISPPVLGVKRSSGDELEGDWVSVDGLKAGAKGLMYDNKSIRKVGNNVFVRVKEPASVWSYIYHFDIDCVGSNHRTTRVYSYGLRPEDIDEDFNVSKWNTFMTTSRQPLVQLVCAK